MFGMAVVLLVYICLPYDAQEILFSIFLTILFTYNSYNWKSYEAKYSTMINYYFKWTNSFAYFYSVIGDFLNI